MAPTITVSNGNEFYRIPLSDLEDAIGDGFYVPSDRSLTIVSDGTEIFEIPIQDVAEAEQDGFQDVLRKERKKNRKRQPGPRALATAAVPFGGDDGFAAEASRDDWIRIEVEGAPEEVLDVAEVAVDAAVVEAELEQMRQIQEEMLAEATGFRKALLYVKFRLMPEPDEQERLAKVYGSSFLVNLMVLLILAMIAMGGSEHLEEFLIDTRVNDAKIPTVVEEPEVQIEEPDPAPENEVTEIQSDTLEKDNFDINISDNKLAAPTSLTNLAMTSKGMPSLKLSGALGGRSKAGRMSLLTKRGGSAASESAVQNALDWLVRHQVKGGPMDGSWMWNNAGVADCTCASKAAIGHEGRMGATGIALLTFLGYGTTHLKFVGDVEDEREERFRQATARGFDFMMRAFLAEGADFRGGGGHHGMYCQGLATTAMCEAMAMNQAFIESMDSRTVVVLASGKKANKKQLMLYQKRLRMAAIAATAFIVEAQDPKGGGWGYSPQSAGDTSILGWQVMALKSAYFSKIEIPPAVWLGANHFLDGVAAQGGATYGYRGPQTKPSTTAIGLLTRMYTNKNLDHENPALGAGVKYLAKTGPNIRDMYYTYYGTQVIFHFGGETWKAWNAKLRPQLVNSQTKEGHAAGSWNLNSSHAARGGRLFETCLCAMTLEVYYRHMPLYKVFHEDDEGSKKKDSKKK